MTRLMDLLQKEVAALNDSGAANLQDLMHDSMLFLADLRSLEQQLHDDESTDVPARLEASCNSWYKNSIGSLKAYNGQINRFTKNVVSSAKYAVSLDDAYTFPLNVEGAPNTVTNTNGATLPDLVVRLENHSELMKCIVLHFLKTGQGSAVSGLLLEFGVDGDIAANTLAQFAELSEIVAQIQNHDLAAALAWLDAKERGDSGESAEPADSASSANSAANSPASYLPLLFKLHMLQFALLLAGNGDNFHIGSAMSAYNYATQHFSRFFKDYMHEISPVITLLLFKSTDDFNSSDLKTRIMLTFARYKNRDRRHEGEVKFIADILACFDDLQNSHALFDAVAHEVVAQYCTSMGLPTESPLFQAMLAGYINLPNFYKYTQLQRRLGKGTDENAGPDLPFQLPDKNQFLFNFHPIFICPVSKEQLMPSTQVEDGMLVPMANPVVVFDHCRHLALRDSVRHLTKGGSEMFKCHYCYKKHKLLDVSDAYFIDL